MFCIVTFLLKTKPFSTKSVGIQEASSRIIWLIRAEKGSGTYSSTRSGSSVSDSSLSDGGGGRAGESGEEKQNPADEKKLENYRNNNDW